ncbi:hypothetical protein F4561_006183 [Lipingzhangella halophila]|uniref:Uncharacterized protein n=1 Tax=Lipingzhangella halophila TaxID=1783352 RepID=A0A7W7RNJ6_9ACTN|nr:hypothetical protein [Lipingzhangella halophila]MBB4935289.1 hypothetical protein [Lipingzhangella halophila]
MSILPPRQSARVRPYLRVLERARTVENDVFDQFIDLLSLLSAGVAR